MKPLTEIQQAVSARIRQESEFFTLVDQGHSATLWLALAECGFDIDELRAHTIQCVDRIASETLGLSRTHCALIRISDWATCFSGIAYLDRNLSLFGVTAPSLRDFWFHLDTLEYEHWRPIGKAVNDASAEWRQNWIRTAQIASRCLPDHFYWAGQATVEVGHKPAADLLTACVIAKHHATLEIIAAGAPEPIELNYLSLFGFSSLDDIPPAGSRPGGKST
ncbi:MAG TPA: hypothetical protein VIG90_17240 [Pedomonas sp.]|uniref:hypothetical protein n=1 Tax=Pedomonas sp. TaxID=2976421 RepID=UPI002F414407